MNDEKRLVAGYIRVSTDQHSATDFVVCLQDLLTMDPVDILKVFRLLLRAGIEFRIVEGPSVNESGLE